MSEPHQTPHEALSSYEDGPTNIGTPDAQDDGDRQQSSDALPPVEPPSAGFIVQLFLVPGLIVLAVVGVWALFGRLASGEQDWQSLVIELENGNEHRRWRAAHGLAQMLQADRRRESGQRLAENPLVIDKLTGLLADQLEAPTQDDDELKFRAFLARTLGMLEAPDEVLPVLQEAMQPSRDREVRKNAIASVAVIAGRSDERGDPLTHPPVVDDLVEASGDSDPLIRQLGAYALGLFDDERAHDRLVVMLDDSDGNTRVNAALALGRRGSTEGLDVFKSVLNEAGEPFEPRGISGESEGERQQAIVDAKYQQDLRVKNTLDAVENLAGNFTAEQREELIGLLRTVADEYRRRGFRVRAEAVVTTLEEAD